MAYNHPLSAQDNQQGLSERLQFALQTAQVGIWDLDILNQRVWWDERCKELYGFQRDESVSYQQQHECIHPDDAQRVDQAVQWALDPQSTGAYDIEFRTIGASDGQLRWVHCQGQAFFNKQDLAYRFTGIAQDITQRIEAQQREPVANYQAQRQQQIYESITSNTPDLMYVFDLNYRFIYVNQALMDMWGRSWKESIGKSLLEIGYQPWHAQMHEREIDQVAATKQPIRGEVSFAHSRLGKRIYDYVFAPILNDEGEVEAVAGTTRDITHIKQAQELIQKSEARLRSLIEETPVATCLFMGRNLAIEIANEPMITFFGKGRSILNKPIRDVLSDAAPDQAAIALLDQVFATGEPYMAVGIPANLTINGLAGTYYFDLSLKPLRNADGEVYAVLETAIDVTEQVNAQHALQQRDLQQTFLLRLADRLRSLTDPLEVFYQAACLLGEYLGANRVGYAKDQGDGKTITVLRNYVNGVADLQGTYQYADYGPLLAEFLCGRTVVRSDIAHDPTLTEAEKEAHRVLQLGATVNKPLMQDERLVAVLFIHYQEAHAWSDDELSLLEAVAERVVVAVDRSRAEEALRESEEQFRLLVDALPQAIWVTDTDGKAAYLNKWWADYSGIPFATTAWQIAEDILHPDDGPKLVATFQQAIRQGTGFEIEQRNRSASGEYRWFLNRAEPYRDPKTGQITKWVGIGVDINDRKRAEHALQESEARYRQLSAQLEQQVQQRTEELNNANAELRAANAEFAKANRSLALANENLKRLNENLEQFAYIASHDLQEPLRKIQQFSDLLKQDYADQLGSGAHHLDRMQSAAKRMSQLIRDLLAFSRIATQEVKLAPVSLSQIIGESLDTLSVAIEESGALIEVDSLPTVQGDASQLGQLFQNLLSNAIKFHKPCEKPQIRVRAQTVARAEVASPLMQSDPNESYHRIEISDKGIGFDAKYTDRIFQVFQRLHGKNEFAGTGVGLAICQKVVTNHGGLLTAHSQPGQGATFTVYLPV
jgi:PAS domain S-box-containing protein